MSSKKDLASVTTDLSALAATMPTQRPAPAQAVSEAPALKVVPWHSSGQRSPAAAMSAGSRATVMIGTGTFVIGGVLAA